MSEKPNKIETTGQLRRFLADMLVGIKNGHVEPDKASRMTKMAAQINESIYSELKAAKVRIEAGEQVAEMGKLKID